MTGWRIGWLTGPAALITLLISLNLVIDLWAQRFRQPRCDRSTGERLWRQGDRRALCERGARSSSTRCAASTTSPCAAPKAACMSCSTSARSSPTARNSPGACSTPRRSAVMPGSSFGDAAAGHIRISLCQPDDVLQGRGQPHAPLRRELREQGRVSNLPDQGPRRHHRRRRLRLLGRLSSGQARLDRHRAARAQAADLAARPGTRPG